MSEHDAQHPPAPPSAAPPSAAPPSTAPPSTATVPPVPETVRLDAVCGMVVARDSPHRHEHEGTTYLFCCDGCLERFRAAPRSFLAPAPAAEHLDPVCGMSVAADSPHRLEHDGTTYRFCCAGCVERFRADPDRFLGDRQEEPQDMDAEYTCPMHPEVVQVGPGSCPDCGMALEPMMVTATVQANPELADMTRRFWVSLALGLPLVVVAMARCSVSGCSTGWSRRADCTGSSWPWPRRWCCGAAGRSSSGAGSRWSTAASTCSR